MRRPFDSLFARLFLLLVAILLGAQLIGAALQFRERGEVLKYATGYNSATRIAGIVRLLDPLPRDQRERAVSALDLPPLRIHLAKQPMSLPQADNDSARALLFRQMLDMELGAGQELSVHLDEELRPGMLGWGPPAGEEGHMPGMMRRHMAGGWGPPPGYSYLAQVRLGDGQWALFAYRLPTELAAWPLDLLLTLAVVVLSAILASFLAVRWAVRPLRRLAHAADTLGRDITHPPIDEAGPAEVRQAAHAFNTMQARIARFVEERTRILAAVSHDLKTPITRLRLRLEGMEEGELRAKMERDLDEMQVLVIAALDFMRGDALREESVPLDLANLLDILQADTEEAGGDLRVECHVTLPYQGKPMALRRCIGNLIDNALRYAGTAEVQATEGEGGITILVLDHGPGIPDADKERILEPFQRLDPARTSGSGGTGLGLSIARNIARAHGGDLTLHDREGGGLEVRVALPRRAPYPPHTNN